MFLTPSQISRTYRAIFFEFSPTIASTGDDTCLTSGVINSFSAYYRCHLRDPRHARWYYADERSRRAGTKTKRRTIQRNTRILFTHRLAPYARPPTEWSLPEGVPVVGAGTARHVSHPWFSSYTCISVARVSRDTVVSLPRRDWTPDLPRDYVYPTIQRRARGAPPPLCHPPLSHPVARANETKVVGVARPARRSSSPPSSRSRRSSRFDVPWRGRWREEDGISRVAEHHCHSRRRSRPAGWLTD